MRKSRLKGVLAAASVIALFVTAIIAVSVLEHMSEKTPEGAGTISIPVSGQSRGEKHMTIGGEGYRLDPDISTLLLIGTDDMELEQHEGCRSQAMADYLALAILNSREKTCIILQIDRNTMAEVPVLGSNGKSIGTTTHQICYAYAYGDGLKQSCENTVNTVSRLLCGVPIDNYFSLAMGAIPVLNDAVGGVTVTVEDDFTGVDDTLIQGNTVHLTGGTRIQLCPCAHADAGRRQQHLPHAPPGGLCDGPSGGGPGETGGGRQLCADAFQRGGGLSGHGLRDR